MLSSLKKISPEFILRIARDLRSKTYKFFDDRKPYLNFITYKGYDLYYTKGTGLINRIRPGSMAETYEPELVNALLDELKAYKEPVFLDIGTNIGLITIGVISGNPKVKVFSFEPSPVVMKSFQTTIFANQLESRISFFPYAVSNTDGDISFATHISEHASGDGMIDTNRAPEGGSKVITLHSKKLDTWWNEQQKPHISVVKIDIEGAELYALQGGINFIQSCKPTIFLEISTENLKVYPYKEGDVLHFFDEINYLLTTLSGEVVNKNNVHDIVHKTDSFVARPHKV